MRILNGGWPDRRHTGARARAGGLNQLQGQIVRIDRHGDESGETYYGELQVRIERVRANSLEFQKQNAVQQILYRK